MMACFLSGVHERERKEVQVELHRSLAEKKDVGYISFPRKRMAGTQSP